MAPLMHSELPWEVWSRERQRRIEDVLERALADEPGRLGEAMRYAALGGGKRVRPLLAYAAGEVAGADPVHVDAPAAAVELIHAYSLVHDDLPAMDNDTLRRGKPTCHVAFGDAFALLAGDALQARAFALLAASRMSAPAEACALLARAAGASGMAGGQGLDLAATGTTLALSELTKMHRMKTGALIGAAVQLGARSGRSLTASQSTALDLFASAAGLAFQVIDDLLDVEGSAASLGKTAGKDAAVNKPTFVSLLGLAEARRHAQALRSEAHDALAPFGDSGRRLHELVDWIVTRHN
jgi:farnesyl diphosphate synthase